jgi:ribonuclease Z
MASLTTRVLRSHLSRTSFFRRLSLSGAGPCTRVASASSWLQNSVLSKYYDNINSKCTSYNRKTHSLRFFSSVSRISCASDRTSNSSTTTTVSAAAAPTPAPAPGPQFGYTDHETQALDKPSPTGGPAAFGAPDRSHWSNEDRFSYARIDAGLRNVEREMFVHPDEPRFFDASLAESDIGIPYRGLDIVFLGTSATVPQSHRSLPCIALRYRNRIWLFDAGEGSLGRLMQSHLKLTSLENIFISHLHSDHFLGLPQVLYGYTSQEFNVTPVNVFGPPGLSSIIHQCVRDRRLMSNINVVEMLGRPRNNRRRPPAHSPHTLSSDHPRGVMILYEDDSVVVKAIPIVHRILTFGYVIEEKKKVGKLNLELLQEWGIPPGPLYGKLLRGESVVAPDGRVVTPTEVLSTSKPGRKVVIVSDTCDASAMLPEAQNANIVIHECTYADEERVKAIYRKHATPGIAAEFASQCKAETLILNHISPRYKFHASALIKQASRSFSGKVLASEDLTIFRL